MTMDDRDEETWADNYNNSNFPTRWGREPKKDKFCDDLVLDIEKATGKCICWHFMISFRS